MYIGHCGKHKKLNHHNGTNTSVLRNERKSDGPLFDLTKDYSNGLHAFLYDKMIFSCSIMNVVYGSKQSTMYIHRFSPF